MTCRLMSAERALALAWTDRVMRDGRDLVRAARRERCCVWCAAPVAPGRDYPACEPCREAHGVEAP